MKIRKRGISLIVLVITIVVMIILASTIILSISSGDIRGKANEAVISNDMATAKEIISVARSEWELNYDELKGEYGNDFKKYAIKKLEKAGITNVSPSNEGAINIIYTDKKGDIAIIPEGFNVSKVQTEQIIDDGLVIVDKDDNEYVWVPVDNMARFERTTTYQPTESISAPSIDFTEPFSKTNNGITLSIANDLTGEWKEYTEMYNSVTENGGFYIARYEAGKGENNTVVSKKGAKVWVNIPWGAGMTNIGTLGAVYRARQMYEGAKSVVSTLCYGVQWDAALQFIATKDAEYPKNSTSKGYYTYDINSKLIEGMKQAVQEAGYYAVNNIYDMAGNVSEWTMEAHSNNKRFIRGGSYLGNGVYHSASVRGEVSPIIDGNSYGFRIALYIK